MTTHHYCQTEYKLTEEEHQIVDSLMEVYPGALNLRNNIAVDKLVERGLVEGKLVHEDHKNVFIYRITAQGALAWGYYNRHEAMQRAS